MLCSFLAVVLNLSLASDVNAQGGVRTGYDAVGFVNSPAAVVIDEKSTPTLDKMDRIDFVTVSTVGASRNPMTKEEIDEKISAYGRFDGPEGMPFDEYREAMENVWANVTDYAHKAEKVDVDMTKAYRYSELVGIMKSLSRYDGVSLYEIGRSTEGRTMYALEIDVPSSAKKKTVVLTGSIHARETAGTTYLLKELSDLLSANTAESRSVLSRIRFADVPCCNPDGREGVAFDTRAYTTSDGQFWKATTNGTDLNRNFPGLVWSQVANGNKKSASVAKSPRGANYPGDHAGSCAETRALMKFLYYYIAVEKAPVLVDYHQQGRLSYAGKPYSTTRQQNVSKDMADKMVAVLNRGNRHNYASLSESADYGLNGTGSTLTDYACSIAFGAKHSTSYGFCVYVDGTTEYPLCAIRRADESPVAQQELVPGFRSITIEIGYGRQYLGYSYETRRLLADEYSSRHFDRFLYELAKYCDGLR
ncbi:MAG: hypothetical protein ILP23_01590 [Paludibacteraceae bacterium]|nr:hypothetical protein [Paludibacteraceae bacterium]